MGGFLPVVVGLEGVDTGHSTHGEGPGFLDTFRSMCMAPAGSTAS